MVYQKSWKNWRNSFRKKQFCFMRIIKLLIFVFFHEIYCFRWYFTQQSLSITCTFQRENSGEAALPVDLAKMKKLEELLEKCKMSIGEYKEKNIQLTEENKKLKETVKGASDEVCL